jgi:hypothetical protein
MYDIPSNINYQINYGYNLYRGLITLYYIYKKDNDNLLSKLNTFINISEYYDNIDLIILSNINKDICLINEQNLTLYELKEDNVKIFNLIETNIPQYKFFSELCLNNDDEYFYKLKNIDNLVPLFKFINSERILKQNLFSNYVKLKKKGYRISWVRVNGNNYTIYFRLKI